MVANGANLRLGVAAHLRIERLRVLRPERRHPRAGQDVAGVLQPVENPVGLQPVGRHPQIRREVRRSAGPSESRRARGTAGTAAARTARLPPPRFCDAVHDLRRLERVESFETAPKY